MMKLVLFFVISCMALHNCLGAPATAVYKFVKCNPEGDQANCVVQKTKEVAWNQLLPSKLPASAARFMDAEPEEDESPEWAQDDKEEDEEMQGEEEGEDEDEEEEMNNEDEEEVKEEGENSEVSSEKGESPVENGSGSYEGFSGDGAFVLPADGGSGELWTGEDGLFKGGVQSGLTRLMPSRSLFDEAKLEEQELKKDDFLQP